MAGGTETYSNFKDFLDQNHLQVWDGLKDPGQDVRVPGDPMHTLAMNIAKHIDQLDPDSVALNKTINMAVVAVGQPDQDDPNKGTVNIFAYDERNQRTYAYTADVTVKDGKAAFHMNEKGQSWDVLDDDEGHMLDSLSDKFGKAAAPKTSLVAAFEKQSGRDLAVGGVDSIAGEYEVRQGPGKAAVASAADLNDRLGVEIESSYGEAGAQMNLTLFRQNAAAITAETASAPGQGNKYDAYMGLNPGINTLQP